MQGGRGRGGRNSFFDFPDPFAGFGGFGGVGGPGSPMSSFFGGRDPFDDPFFTRPFGGGMFDSSFFRPMRNPFVEMHPSGFIEQQETPEPRRSRGPIIEEINSDDEKEAAKERKENPRKHGRSGTGPYIQDPDDEAEEKKSRHLQLQYGNDQSGLNRAQWQTPTQSFTFQSSSVTYGGANGAHYSSSKTRRTGSDGVTIEESKEADTTTRQASHRLSRALHNKGHSLTRKLNTDGKVDSMQTLHNLNEDELDNFEEAWKGTAQKHLPGWSGNFSGHESIGGSSSSGRNGQGGWALPSTESSQHSTRWTPNTRDGVALPRSQHSGRVKTPDVRDRSSYPRGRTRE